MRADSAEFASYNTAANKRPRVVIELSFNTANTDLLYLTSHADCDVPAGAVSSGITIQNVVKNISGQTQEINPDQANSTIGGFSFSVIDKTFAVTNYLNTKLDGGNSLRKKRVRAYIGYRGMLWADYALVLTYIVDGVSYMDGEYKFKCSDIQREVRKQIFQPEVTYLSKSVTANQGRIPCLASNVALFPTVLHDASYTVHPNLNVNYIKVEDEIIAHEGLFTHGVDGVSFRVLAEYTGTHTGANNASVLTNSSATFVASALIGLLIENTTDGSTGTITANTTTTVTATLSGGTDNDWDTSDAYKIYTGRGALNTRAAEHVMNSSAATERRLKIEEYIFIEGPTPKVAYQLLTGIVAQNLLTYSSDFTNAVWTDPSSQWTVTGNTDVAPDGTTTADTITVTAAGNALLRIIPSPTIAGTATYTASIWARIKAGTADSIDIDIGDSATAGSTRLTSEWQRITHTAVAHATNNWVDFNIINASIGATILLWGAQLSATAAMIPYYPTVATARSALTLPSNWHLGISTAYVRAANFTNIGSDYWAPFSDTGRHARFEALKKTDGKKFIETELLLFMGAYMPIYSTGELGLKRLSPVLSNSGYIAKLDRTNIVNYSDVVHDFGSVINKISVEWNYSPAKNNFTKTNYLVDTTSIAIYQDSPIKNLKLKGVHTGSHTDEDLDSYFDTMRDRYSGAPLLLDVTVKPSLNWLEVGDTVRVDLDEVRDYTAATGTSLSRVFEIQQVSYDWFTGDVKLKLFGSSMKAGSLTKTALSAVLADAFYNSAGTELSTVLTISGGAVTANGSLAGGNTLAEGIYYYLGNLTINSGVTVTLGKNVQLRIRGHLTVNGTLNGAGGGHAGGVGATLWSNGTTSIVSYAGYYGTLVFPGDNVGSGLRGYVGSTKSAGATLIWQQSAGHTFYSKDIAGVSGSNNSIAFQAIKNASTSIIGLPTDMRGTSGPGGGHVSRITAVSGLALTWSLVAGGGAGGAGGAGLMIVSRGLSFGAAGVINLSGADGALGGTYTYNGAIFHAGTGGGGAAGGFVLLLDGNHTPPELAGSTLVQNHGDSAVLGEPLALFTGAVNNYGANNFPHYTGFASYDLAAAGYTLQYIPEYKPVEEELPPPPPNVTGLTVANDGLYARVTWSALANAGAVKYKIKLGSTWSTATFLADIDGTEYKHLMTAGATYAFMVAAVDQWGQESQTPASASVAGLPAVSIGSNLIGADDYLAATFFYRFNYDGTDGVVLDNITLINSYLRSNFIGVSTAVKGASIYKHPALEWAKQWKFKSVFTIETGFGQYLSTITGTNRLLFGGSGSGSYFGIVFNWNATSSRIEIYGESSYDATATRSLLTDIADVKTPIYAECQYTPGVSVVCSVTISGTTYTQTITTNLPPTTSSFSSLLEARIASPVTATDFRLHDFLCLQLQ